MTNATETDKQEEQLAYLEEFRDEVLALYMLLECDICAELRAIGFQNVQSDYCDGLFVVAEGVEDFTRRFEFDTSEDLERFESIVGALDRSEWSKGDYSIQIPRRSLYDVYKCVRSHSPGEKTRPSLSPN